MGSRVGGSFTAFTVSVNDVLALLTPSFTVNVIVALLLWLGAGVIVAVWLVPVPLATIFVAGTNAGLDELAVTVRNNGNVSTSLIVIGTVIGVSSGVAWGPMAAIVGAAFS